MGQRRAFGATSREPDQSRPALTLDVWASPAVGAASPMSLGSTWPGRPDLGVSSQMYPPSVSGVSDYDKPMKDGKLVVEFPINVWPGWAPIIVANNGMEANEGSVFFKKYGFFVQLSLVDDPLRGSSRSRM